MDPFNMMKNMQEVKAKQELRSTDFGKKLEDVMTAMDNLIAGADIKQLEQLERTGQELSRASRYKMKQLNEPDYGFDEE